MQLLSTISLLAITAQSVVGTISCSNTRPYSVRMADSVIARGDATAPQSHEPESSVYLKVGVFQTAVLRLLEYYRTPQNVCAEHDWVEYLQESSESVIPWLGNKTRDGGYPLDRFSVGRGLFHEYVFGLSCDATLVWFQIIDAKTGTQQSRTQLRKTR